MNLLVSRHGSATNAIATVNAFSKRGSAEMSYSSGQYLQAQQSRISKSVNNHQTATQVEALSGEERVTEIARMLAGIELTDESLAHARQMLAHHL